MLSGTRLLITGVADSRSIAFAVADRAQDLGAEVALTAPPRDLERCREAAGELRKPVAVHEVDLTDPESYDRLGSVLDETMGGVDGALHAVAFAPRPALDGPLSAAAPDGIELAFRTSTWSYAALGAMLADHAGSRGASLVGLDFQSDRAWPTYNWMGVCKHALESVNRYLARDLGPRGVRANLVAAGPIHTRAAGGIPGFDLLLEAWANRSPLVWDPEDAAPVADAVCFLLSDMARSVTGEILHADAGFHAIEA